MSRTRTAGITIDRNGFRTMNKEYRCQRIFARLGLLGQEEAERRLAQEIERLDWELSGERTLALCFPIAPTPVVSKYSIDTAHVASR
jgi:hypothetical protein